MNNREIYEAYEAMVPDVYAKNRMLRNIMIGADAERTRRQNRGSLVRRSLVTAAVLAALLCLGVAAYATEWFGLGALWIGSRPVGPEITAPKESDELPPAPTIESDFISTQGFAGSPEYMASTEWEAFLQSYDPDGKILSSIGNSDTGLEDRYSNHGCYTREMADKLDEIVEKYGLTLHSGEVQVVNDGQILDKIGAPGLCRQEEGRSLNSAHGGYYYEDGTFQYEGAVVFQDGTWTIPVEYQLRRTVKGTFNSINLSIGNINDYDAWSYNTDDGITLLLALGPTSGLIVADLGDTFVVVNVLDIYYGDILYGEVHMTREIFEAFAACFDFAALA